MTGGISVLAQASALPPIFVHVVIILAAAGVTALLMQRLRLAVIPAYLITGALIGPGGLQVVKEIASVQRVGDVAVILLMFGAGMQMDTSALRPSVRHLILLGVAATLSTVAVLWPPARLMTDSWPQALTLAMAFAISSTAAVLPVIQKRHEVHHVDSRLAISISIIQDLFTIVFLMTLPTLARWNGTGSGGIVAARRPEGGAGTLLIDFLVGGVIALGAIICIVLLGRYVLPRLLAEAARQRANETMTVVCIGAALGAAALTAMVGLNAALGAFLGGFLLSSSPFRHHLHGQIGTLRDLFAAMFFTAIGMTIDLSVVADNILLILVGAAALFVLKSFIIGLCCWLAGKSLNVSIKVGLMLFQASEFSLVMLQAANSQVLGLIPDGMMSVLVAIAVVSLIATPSVVNLAANLARKIPDVGVGGWVRPPPSTIAAPIPGAEASAVPKPVRKVIVAGFGLVGRVVADGLSAEGAEVTIIELNPGTVQRQTTLGRRVVFGDVANPEVLESAGIREAHALILTVPDEEAVLSACHAARQSNPTIVIIARTNYVSKGMVATGLGANDVVIEELATAEAMERVVMKHLSDMGMSSWVSKV